MSVVTVSKHALSASNDSNCAKKPRVSMSAAVDTAKAPAPTGMPPAGMPWMGPVPPMMMAPPYFMGPPFMPPPFMAMHAMMQMQMQAMCQPAAAAKAEQSGTETTTKPTAATAAAAALGHPEALPSYPMFPFPGAFYPMPTCIQPAACPPAAQQPVGKAPQQQVFLPPSKLSPSTKPSIATANLSDADFAAFIDSFIGDGPLSQGSDGLAKMPAMQSHGGSDTSSSDSDEFCLDDLLPLDAVLAQVESSAAESAVSGINTNTVLANNLPGTKCELQDDTLLELQELVDGSKVLERADSAVCAEEGEEEFLIFGMGIGCREDALVF